MTKKRALGLDLSYWQKTYTPTPQEDFVIVRSGYGLKQDKCFSTFVDTLAGQGKIVGAYHYFSSAAEWQDQRDFFLSLVQGEDIDFYVLDYEQAFNKLSGSFARDAVFWIKSVQAKSGKKTLLYTNPYTYRDGMLLYTSEVAELPLWIAQYPSSQWWWIKRYVLSGTTRSPYLSPTRRKADDWKIWQITDKATGSEFGVGSTRVDINVFNGTVEEMREYFNIDENDSVFEPSPEIQPDGLSQAEKLKRLWDAHSELH